MKAKNTLDKLSIADMILLPNENSLYIATFYLKMSQYFFYELQLYNKRAPVDQ